MRDFQCNYRLVPATCLLTVYMLAVGAGWAGNHRLHYSVIRLGVPAVYAGAPAYMYPTRINNQGDVVGFFGHSADGPFLYRDGRVYELLSPGDRTEVAWMTINDRGVIAGMVHNSPTPTFVLSTFGDEVDLANARTLELPGFAGWDMNDYGAIIGSIFDPGQNIARAQGVYKNGELIELPGLVPGGYLLAVAINNRGQIIGEARSARSSDGRLPTHAVLWSNGAIRRLGTLPGFLNSTATAINNHGEIVGACYAAIAPRQGSGAFIYRDGLMIELPSPPHGQFCFPTHINDAGDILVYFSRSNEHSEHWLYSKGEFHDLPAVVAKGLGASSKVCVF